MVLFEKTSGGNRNVIFEKNDISIAAACFY
jgi:hypothetical protein